MTVVYDVRALQTALKAKGFDPGKIDGIYGPKTEKAIVAFKRSKGLVARPYVGPITLEALGLPRNPSASDLIMPPWLNEISKHMNLHERNDFQKLYAWLKSDGRTLGDPRVLPWCGDAVETAVRLALHNEPFPGALGRNPYLARNWMLFGKECSDLYGAIAVFWRGTKTGNSGHVGFAIGYDPILRRYRIRGGNQSDSISDAWLNEDRLLGLRWPTSYVGEPQFLPYMDSKGAIVSVNEA